MGCFYGKQRPKIRDASQMPNQTQSKNNNQQNPEQIIPQSHKLIIQQKNLASPKQYESIKVCPNYNSHDEQIRQPNQQPSQITQVPIVLQNQQEEEEKLVNISNQGILVEPSPYQMNLQSGSLAYLQDNVIQSYRHQTSISHFHPQRNFQSMEQLIKTS